MQNILSIIALLVHMTDGQNNICNTYTGYAHMNSKNCWYDPDIGADSIQIIKNSGYNAKTYAVYTEDGYILSLDNIISKKTTLNGEVVLLFHGFLTDSTFWTIWGNKSIAFILSDLGYDVWLANARGTKFSREHVNKSITPANYWDFSFHEMGYYDLPATLELINNKTSCTDIIYIGHSMGTTISFIYGSLKPMHLKKYVKAIIALCPVAFLGHITSVLRSAVPLVDIFPDFFPKTNKYSINEELWISKRGVKFCSGYPAIKKCVLFIMSALGFDFEQFTPDIPIKVYSIVSSISSKTLVHFVQLIDAYDKFQQFDYGIAGNLDRYNRSSPPDYDVTAIPVPIRMFYGKADKLTVEADVHTLFDMLRNNDVTVEVIPSNTSSIRYNHLDFVSAKDNFHLFIKHFIEIIRTISILN